MKVYRRNTNSYTSSYGGAGSCCQEVCGTSQEQRGADGTPSVATDAENKRTGEGEEREEREKNGRGEGEEREDREERDGWSPRKLPSTDLVSPQY